MKFRIETTDWYDASKVVNAYPCLKDFGLEIEEYTIPKLIRIKDENGFCIHQECGSIIKQRPYVNIDTLEQLLALMRAVDNPLIIFDSNVIEIYDNYRE